MLGTRLDPLQTPRMCTTRNSKNVLWYNGPCFSFHLAAEAQGSWRKNMCSILKLPNFTEATDGLKWRVLCLPEFKNNVLYRSCIKRWAADALIWSSTMTFDTTVTVHGIHPLLAGNCSSSTLLVLVSEPPDRPIGSCAKIAKLYLRSLQEFLRAQAEELLHRNKWREAISKNTTFSVRKMTFLSIARRSTEHYESLSWHGGSFVVALSWMNHH